MMQEDQWARAGFVFGLASVVMLIATLIQLHGYYLKDIMEDVDATITLSDICSAWEEEEPDWSFTPEVINSCEPEQQENYQMIWQLLISVGLTMICVGKGEKSKNGSEQVHEQPVVE